MWSRPPRCNTSSPLYSRRCRRRAANVVQQPVRVLCEMFAKERSGSCLRRARGPSGAAPGAAAPTPRTPRAHSPVGPRRIPPVLARLGQPAILASWRLGVEELGRCSETRLRNRSTPTAVAASASAVRRATPPASPPSPGSPFGSPGRRRNAECWSLLRGRRDVPCPQAPAPCPLLTASGPRPPAPC